MTFKRNKLFGNIFGDSLGHILRSDSRVVATEVIIIIGVTMGHTANCDIGSAASIRVTARQHKEVR